jgi:4'-phosphopantetheinyl transferase superfamily
MRVVSTPWDDRAIVIADDGEFLGFLGSSGSSGSGSSGSSEEGDAEYPPRNSEELRGTAFDGWFTETELETANGFKLARRRREWLLSRAAVKQLAVQLGLCQEPRECTLARPLLLLDGEWSGWHVSVSHSLPYAGAVMAKHPVGIDVQVVREIAEWSTHLFLSPEEDAQMRECTLPARVLHFWCAKEAAWKQRSGEFATMKQVPLRVIGETAGQGGDGLLFDQVETRRIGDLIVALTRPTS